MGKSVDRITSASPIHRPHPYTLLAPISLRQSDGRPAVELRVGARIRANFRQVWGGNGAGKTLEILRSEEDFLFCPS